MVFSEQGKRKDFGMVFVSHNNVPKIKKGLRLNIIDCTVVCYTVASGCVVVSPVREYVYY